jgi:hypothetical protein
MIGMCKTWKKMTKDEKLAYAKRKIKMGVAVLIFGLVWNYFTTRYFDVWRALPISLAVMGILCILYGFFRKSSI